MEPRISIITLGVNDLLKSYNFYATVVGFPSERGIENDAIAFFNLNHIILSLYSKDKLAEDAMVPNDGQGFAGITLAYNVKSKDEVDAIIQQVRHAGGKITKQPQEAFWGGYHAYFQDPDGYSWEVAWNPFMWIE